MKYDAAEHKCAIIVDGELPVGLAANAVSVIGISFGREIEGIVGPDRYSKDEIRYPGVIYSPLPVLSADAQSISAIHQKCLEEPGVYLMPFSDLAQSCKTYDEYTEKLSNTDNERLKLVALGLVGPRKLINKLTGNLVLFR
ncbi:hypothetical protein GCM10007860_22200 [Chitiniphilus shinanonensis]|uniref:DUF2000 domain-containing protein n=1 Tax=Chitiniphilus shinanonensis TaxID=553088 RepID=A0ABQ6BSU0_9NEIS|nr:DUF2000 domain-containing protein [Chitiniphilus shinanonensis]GLS05070.1 hypothetical protein GCM10007860_22200 [Chitiniphilus shinanonensis]